MTNRTVTCKLCGIRAGVGSEFKHGLCSQCQLERTQRKGTRTAIWHLVFLVAGVYLISTGVSAEMGILSFLVLAIALCDLIFMVVTVVHEMAHAITALLFGFKVREISIGMGPRVASVRLGDTRLVLNLYPVGGHTQHLPRGDNLLPKLFAVTAAGPLSHIPLAAWAATWSIGDPIWDILIGPMPELIMFYFLINVVPVFDNDGRNLARLFTMPEHRLQAIDSSISSLSELLPTLDDPVANPPNRVQRDAILEHLQSPGLTPAERAFALNNLAVVDVILDDLVLMNEADEASREAYELLPDHPAMQNTRGSVLIRTGAYADGIALMKPTLTRIPANFLGDSHLHLAHAHTQLGRAFEGRDHLYAARDGHLSPRLFTETLAALGKLETDVIRQFAEPGEEQTATAARFRREAGPQAAITGEAIKAHIAATGEDADLMDLAGALSPD